MLITAVLLAHLLTPDNDRGTVRHQNQYAVVTLPRDTSNEAHHRADPTWGTGAGKEPIR